MKKKLFIVEKPNVKRIVGKALGLNELSNGDFENETIILTNMRGHLIEAEQHEVYTGKKEWDLNYLPLFPDDLKLRIKQDKVKNKVDDYAKSQLERIGNYLKQSDGIINGMDSDREGEAIFRTLVKYLNISLPTKRFWLNDLDENKIRIAFNDLYSYEDVFNKKLNTNLYKLSLASELRQYLDWIIGINATQYFSLLHGQGKTFSLGRVQTAILAIICERYDKNKSHEKTYTYRIVALHEKEGIKFKTLSEIYEDKTLAEQDSQKLSSKFKVLDYHKKEEKENPPLLYNFDSLIEEVNKVYKYDPKTILSVAQSLYEKALISYPRTDCNYIGKGTFENVKNYIDDLAKIIGYEGYGLNHQPKSVNDDKLDSSHDAIIAISANGMNMSLDEKERNVYAMICLKMLESFSFQAVFEKTTVKLENEGIAFVGHSRNITDWGYKKIRNQYLSKVLGKSLNDIEKLNQEADPNQQASEGNTTIPNLKKDDLIPGTKTIKEIESKPKPIFTAGTLISALTNIVQYLKEEGEDINELKKYISFSDVGLGTENTRVHIIERLLEMKYIELKNNKYYPTEFGFKFYQLIKNAKISRVKNTARMEADLKRLERGEISPEELKSQVKSFAQELLDDIKALKNDLNFNEKKAYGICPKCKKNVVETKISFGCEDYKNCDFKIWKEIAGKTVPKNAIADILTEGITKKPISGFKKKDGTGEFTAKLKWSAEDNKIVFILEKIKSN